MNSPVFRCIVIALIGALMGLATLASPARAGMGPCKSVKLENGPFLMCGTGEGSAMVIPDTVSPNRQFALAWRDPKGEPTDEPSDGGEMLLVRISDGSILARADTGYFNTGAMRANHQHETADWSPDSRMVVRRYDTRYDTDAASLFVIAQDGTLAGELDLLKIIQPAVNADLTRRKQDPEALDFSMFSTKNRLANDGTYRVTASAFQPKGDAMFNYAVTVKITPNKSGNGAPEARITGMKATK